MALREREAMRVAKWDRMLEVHRVEPGAACYGLLGGLIKSKKLRKRVYKGIPDRWRAAVWWALLREQSNREPSFGIAEHEYRRLLDQPSLHDVQIDLDVPRTISGHVLFHTRYGQGQRSLFHVLHAFSLLCPKCAYCQGMGPIAATLLVYFPLRRRMWSWSSCTIAHSLDSTTPSRQAFLSGGKLLRAEEAVREALSGSGCIA
ncbi:hypothetical protein L7F22_057753 [Adiantum nelumboides]|nr:hypothetical protein [Adiantum nelumboides]